MCYFNLSTNDFTPSCLNFLFCEIRETRNLSVASGTWHMLGLRDREFLYKRSHLSSPNQPFWGWHSGREEGRQWEQQSFHLLGPNLVLNPLVFFFLIALMSSLEAPIAGNLSPITPSIWGMQLFLPRIITQSSLQAAGHPSFD